MSRPEYIAPPEIFYNSDEASKYTQNGRIIQIQSAMTHRAVELCLLPKEGGSLVLDIGCGSGLSGNVLSELGHFWVGVDVSPHMLEAAVENEVEGDTLLADIGQLMRFRPGSFDGAVSISTIQWLCNADKSHHVPYKRLLCFFSWIYEALKKGARAVFQFYPDTPQQAEMITSAAMRSGFRGGLVVDFPNSAKAKKYYLCLWAGILSGASVKLPSGIPDNVLDYASSGKGPAVPNSTRDRTSARPARKNKGKTHAREWVLRKKERQRQQGLKVRVDTKYTGRKRKDRF